MSIYQHFRKHEHPFVDQVLSWKEQVERTYTYYLTDFLDPREQQVISSLIGNSGDIQYSFFGGNQSERKRAIIAPFYEEITEEIFEITLLEGKFDDKFNRIEHRDILGAFMSLGIDRKKVGDIIVGGKVFQLIVAEELSPYITLNLTQIKNASIRLKEKPINQMITRKNEWITSEKTVSSLRLDNIIKEIYHMSRKSAVQYIKGNRVKVNFMEMDDPSVPVLADDLISVRGYGRSKIVEINGKTRKDKYRITTARLKK